MGTETERQVKSSVTMHNDRRAEARMEASIVASTFVREARTRANLTQQQLADALGVTVTRICDIEKRRRRKGAKFAYDSISLSFLFEVQTVTGVKLTVRQGGSMPYTHGSLCDTIIA